MNKQHLASSTASNATVIDDGSDALIPLLEAGRQLGYGASKTYEEKANGNLAVIYRGGKGFVAKSFIQAEIAKAKAEAEFKAEQRRNGIHVDDGHNRGRRRLTGSRSRLD